MFSCATVPSGPLPPVGMKLIRVNVPEAESIRADSQYLAYIEFESEGKPEIKDVCFTWSGDGPHCFKVSDLYQGSPSILKVQLRTAHPGLHVLECFALYSQDRKMRKTNVISTRIRILPK